MKQCNSSTQSKMIFREVFLGGGKEKEPVENFFDCRQSKFSTSS
jgi:hypothetical protein